MRALPARLRSTLRALRSLRVRCTHYTWDKLAGDLREACRGLAN